jgi:dTDP-L-rhamnose 4-epimerase
MSIYGEGLARRADGAVISPDQRALTQLRRGQWEVIEGHEVLEPLPTPETKQPSLSSVYALNKFTQERLSLIVGQAYDIPTVALRFFNVYGPRQALSNPYTGVLAIFAARLLHDRPPMVFEDGHQRRDFVHVSDVANACLLALTAERATGKVFNVGSGQSRSVMSIAQDLAKAVGRPDITPHVTGKYRAGDIRHCFADIASASAELSFTARTDFQEGLVELAEWLSSQVADDRVEQATAELQRRGLVA